MWTDFVYILCPAAAKYGSISRSDWRWSCQFPVLSALMNRRRISSMSIYCNHSLAVWWLAISDLTSSTFCWTLDTTADAISCGGTYPFNTLSKQWIALTRSCVSSSSLCWSTSSSFSCKLICWHSWWSTSGISSGFIPAVILASGIRRLNAFEVIVALSAASTSKCPLTALVNAFPVSSWLCWRHTQLQVPAEAQSLTSIFLCFQGSSFASGTHPNGEWHAWGHCRLVRLLRSTVLSTKAVGQKSALVWHYDVRLLSTQSGE